MNDEEIKELEKKVSVLSVEAAVEMCKDAGIDIYIK
jgi:hypothetical protein